jgi:hypothetical protein
MTLPGFAFVAGRLRQQGVLDLPAASAWRRWLLEDDRVRALFLEYAGSVKRIDWTYDALEEMVHAAL